MSRSGYTDDCDDDPLATGRWIAAVGSSIRGKRGQQFLSDLLAALEAMPDKRLISDELESDGDFCAFGVLGRSRGIDMRDLDPEDAKEVALAFGISETLAREIVYQNDEYVDVFEWVDLVGPPTRKQSLSYYGHPQIRVLKPHPERDRWQHVRDWVASKITVRSKQ